jgi:hypothetical protein
MPASFLLNNHKVVFIIPHKEPEIKNALIKFNKLLKDHQADDAKGFLPFKNFLRGFIRIRTKSNEIPTSEIITILKHERPNIFYLLKKNLTDDPLFNFITQIDTKDYDKARDKINELLL